MMKTKWGRAAQWAAPTLAALLLAACGGAKAVPTAKPAKGLEFSAWLVFWEPLSWKSFEANVTRLTRVYPEAYSCQPDGTAGRISVAGADDLKKTVALAHAHGVKVLGTMNNYADGGFDKVRVEKFLRDDALMQKHIEGLLALAKADGLDGLDVDYESLVAADRQGFTAFVTRLAQLVHARGLELGVAVHPKESEPGGWDAPQAQDYRALGAQVDHFHVMTYDFHWAAGQPGPVAPLPWIRSVMSFAATQVPKAKLEMGLNAYGLHWNPKGQDLKWTDYQVLSAAKGAFSRDAASNELTLKYAGGEAWFPDVSAQRAKFALAHELGLSGIAMWMLGQEDPGLWALADAEKGTK
jgi:spore germination protein YaaH